MSQEYWKLSDEFLNNVPRFFCQRGRPIGPVPLCAQLGRKTVPFQPDRPRTKGVFLYNIYGEESFHPVEGQFGGDPNLQGSAHGEQARENQIIRDKVLNGWLLEAPTNPEKKPGMISNAIAEKMQASPGQLSEKAIAEIAHIVKATINETNKKQVSK